MGGLRENEGGRKQGEGKKSSAHRRSLQIGLLFFANPECAKAAPRSNELIPSFDDSANYFGLALRLAGNHLTKLSLACLLQPRPQGNFFPKRREHRLAILAMAGRQQHP